MTQQELEKVIHLVTTHTEQDGSYCDTGDDMDWYCRSHCTAMAVNRLKDEFSSVK